MRPSRLRPSILRPSILRPRICASIAGAALVLVLGHAPTPVRAQTMAPPALSGTVTSAEEGAMEGVVVSARKAGSIVTVSVVSDGKGQFSFPAGKLGAGEYALSIRAAGYDLDGAKDGDARRRQASRRRREARQDQESRAHSSPTRNGCTASPAPTTRRTRCSAAPTATASSASSIRPTPPTSSSQVMQAHGQILQQQLLKKPQVRAGRARHRAVRPQRRQGRGVLRQHQSQHGRADLSAQDDAARLRRRHPASSSPNTTCRTRTSSRTT